MLGIGNGQPICCVAISCAMYRQLATTVAQFKFCRGLPCLSVVWTCLYNSRAYFTLTLNGNFPALAVKYVSSLQQDFRKTALTVASNGLKLSRGPELFTCVVATGCLRSTQNFSSPQRRTMKQPPRISGSEPLTVVHSPPPLLRDGQSKISTFCSRFW